MYDTDESFNLHIFDVAKLDEKFVNLEKTTQFGITTFYVFETETCGTSIAIEGRDVKYATDQNDGRMELIDININDRIDQESRRTWTDETVRYDIVVCEQMRATETTAPAGR
jgi:hypothetical protein